MPLRAGKETLYTKASHSTSNTHWILMTLLRKETPFQLTYPRGGSALEYKILPVPSSLLRITSFSRGPLIIPAGAPTPATYLQHHYTLVHVANFEVLVMGPNSDRRLMVLKVRRSSIGSTDLSRSCSKGLVVNSRSRLGHHTLQRMRPPRVDRSSGDIGHTLGILRRLIHIS